MKNLKHKIILTLIVLISLPLIAKGLYEGQTLFVVQDSNGNDVFRITTTSIVTSLVFKDAGGGFYGTSTAWSSFIHSVTAGSNIFLSSSSPDAPTISWNASVATATITTVTSTLANLTNIKYTSATGTSESVDNLYSKTANGAITVNASSTFKQSTTIGCLRVYQKGATAFTSSTFYLVASTTNTNGYFTVLATSTKPTYCP